MIKIIDPQKYGLLLWGTKLGAQSFAQSNIEADSKRPFTDLREIGVRFNSQDATLFQYEHKENHHSYTIFRNILDWRNRSGYYAITIFIDDKFRAPLDQIHPLLLELADSYANKYYDNAKNQIYQHAREDISLFETILNKETYQLMTATGNSNAEANQLKKALQVYQDHAELEQYLRYLHPTEEPDILSLYLYQSGAISIPPETLLEKGLKLPTYPKNLSLKVVVGGLGSNEHDVKFKVKGEEYQPVNGEFTILNLSRRDSLSFVLESGEYEWRKQPQAVYEMKDLANSRYVIELDLQKKPSLISVDIHFGYFISSKKEGTVYITPKNQPKKPYTTQNGKITVPAVVEKTPIQIYFPGNEEVEAFQTSEMVYKDRPISVKFNKKAAPIVSPPPVHKINENGKNNIKKEEDPSKDDNYKLDQKKVLLVVGIVLILLIPIVLYLAGVFSGKEKPKPKPKLDQQKIAIQDLEKKLEKIGHYDRKWSYVRREKEEIQTAIDQLCKIKNKRCEGWQSQLDSSINKAQLRAHLDSLTIFVNSLDKQDRDSLMNIDTTTNYKIDRFKFAYGKEGEKKYSAFKNLIKEKIAETRVNPDKIDPPKRNPPKISTQDQIDVDNFITACNLYIKCIEEKKHEALETKTAFRETTWCNSSTTIKKLDQIQKDRRNAKQYFPKKAKEAWENLETKTPGNFQ